MLADRFKAADAAEPLPFRKAPHNLELEQALLGAVLIHNEALGRVSSFLEAHHFFDPLHQQIFETAAKLIHAGKQATPITLRTFFESAEPISPNLTVPQYLGTLAANATTIINAEDYGRAIRDLATRRSLIIIGEGMVNAAYDSAVDVTPQAQIEEASAQIEKVRSASATGLCPMTLNSLLAADLKARDMMLTGLLQELGTAMLYSWRGGGKTWCALGLGYAVASGGQFLRWKAERPRPVLHVCGEMPAVALRERLEPIANGGKPLPSPDFYRIISADLHEGLPDLASREGQAALDAVMGDAELVILDNISTLCQSGVENEAESWLPVQQWLLRLRRQGRTVVLIHHAVDRRGIVDRLGLGSARNS